MFMITDLRVHHPDLGVHVALILAFTFDRSGRSRWAGARTMPVCGGFAQQGRAAQ
jgi:hypothetical protein